MKRDKRTSPLDSKDKAFILPKTWAWCRLRTLASALGDGLHGTPTYTPGTNYYFINGNNLEDGNIVIKPSTKTVSLEEMQKYSKPLTRNSVLVSINGTLGKIGFYNGEDVVLGKSACYFNLTEHTYKHYIKILISSPYFTKYAINSATGTTILNLSLNAMNELPVPLPPLAEQHRIVAKVDELMTLCDQLEGIVTTAEQTRSRLLEAVLHHALQPSAAAELEPA